MSEIVALEPEWLSDDARAAYEQGLQVLADMRKPPEGFDRWSLARLAEWHKETLQLTEPFVKSLANLYGSATRPRYLIKA